MRDKFPVAPSTAVAPVETYTEPLLPLATKPEDSDRAPEDPAVETPELTKTPPDTPETTEPLLTKTLPVLGPADETAPLARLTSPDEDEMPMPLTMVT